MRPYTRAAAVGPDPLFKPLIASALTGVPGQPYVLQRAIVMLGGVAILSKLLPALSPVIMALLAIHALRGIRETAESCIVLCFVLIGSPNYTPSGTNMLRWVVLFAGFTRLQLDAALYRRANEMRASVFTWALFFFVGVLGVTALLAGVYPLLSVLKLASFFLGTYTIVTAFWRTRSPRYALYWRHWMYSFAAFVIIGSFVAFVLGDAYLRTVRGMQGILTHPQILGPVAATLSGWLLGGILSGSDRSLLSKALVMSGFFLVLFSGARTAGISLVVGLGIAMFFLVLRRERVLDFRAISPASILLMISVGLGIGVAMAPQIQESVTAFIFKNDEAQSAGELFVMSRGQLIERSMSNFRESPITGIGFGAPSDLGDVGRRAESFMDIPFSASSEKGFMPSAILEETGLIGAILVSILLLLLAVPVYKYGSFGVMWGFSACLLTNIGAAVLFSVGGLGFFIWLFIGFCLAQTTLPLHVDAPAAARRRPLPYVYQGYRPSGA